MTTEIRALAAFGVALVSVLLLTPICLRAALRRGILARPNSRGMHRKPVPYLGGLAILGAVVLGAAFCEPSLKLTGLLVAALAVSVVGAIDDIRDLSPLVKLALTLGAVLILFGFGVVVRWIDVPGHGYLAFGPWAVVITGVWVLFVVHATNFTDGIDGLAAGIAAIAAMAFVILAFRWLGTPLGEARADTEKRHAYGRGAAGI